MAGTIKMTPEELREGKKFMLEKLDALVGEANQLKSKIDGICANWEGASQNSFIQTFENDIWPIFKDTLPEVVSGIGEQLGAAADGLEKADEEIANALSGK
ncbi:MAG: WXG100 family type VII secretion target [Peptococcaceae bacterium]|jgi:WXG100 family type VII secretion target|nr:WXG100 family type VII secretion target [Peptococcaceae bacterium]